ncbi:major histocompatibility complex class I-related gene protein-like [Cyprinodon tularosa]|uniref:major histocompatibility complex class I-related gene protein-like n=1 Tax=Cyprinodon tularosa TaxID=77115 RepID=UPI0018E1E794|nr:major histocompatibility complex class I-related gene protein-like [Cyprinodon tularosa]
MEKIVLFLLLCKAVSPEKYHIEIHIFLYPGVQNSTDFAVTFTLEGFLLFYIDINGARVYQDWIYTLMKEKTHFWNSIIKECIDYKQVLTMDTINFNDPLLTSPGDVIIQQIIGCDWDNKADKVNGHIKYGNNGEDFIELDLKTKKWIAMNPKAEAVTKEWNDNPGDASYWQSYLEGVCLERLKMFLSFGKTHLSKKVLQNVFLLQKTPSSAVSCYSTGFFPNNGMMFWRGDGEEIHEGVKHGDILPNDDGSFQMSVDLEVPSIPPKEWGRYECVFELSGVQTKLITKLDKDKIRSNNSKNSIADDGRLTTKSMSVIAAMGGVIISSIFA